MIQGIIDKGIAAERLAEQAGRVSSGKFSVSDAGKCHLYRYWKRQGKEGEAPDARGLRVFEVGKVMEQVIIKRLQDDMLRADSDIKSLATQVVVEDDNRKGLIDLILTTKEDYRILYDIKTVHSKKFWRNKKEGWNNADRHYKCQVLTYQDMLPVPCDSVRLLYLSKDDLLMEEVGVTGNETTEVNGNPMPLSHFKAMDWDCLLWHWAAQIEPLPNPMSWECLYCGYETSCKYGKEETDATDSR